MKFEDILTEEILNEMTLEGLTSILSNPQKLNKYYSAIKMGKYEMVGKDRYVVDSTNKKLSRQYVENTLHQKGILTKVSDREKVKVILDYYLPSFA